jgi:uncharacterized protein YjiS (DUF1127 family)
MPTTTRTGIQMTTFHISLPTHAPLLQRMSGLRAELADKLAKRKLYNSTLRELDALSDRDLNDLGLSRSVIKSIAFEAAYGR